ncbi:CCNT2_2 [Blepharisma stoltei]|uniref:Cyclin-like domain-containing protein n=1 Tax=Blepharisma stoltei TaxID=1481888 RepID=A0AAU9J8L7_9CILI|nr:unnamed protein product [Blepharisma stoltei]
MELLKSQLILTHERTIKIHDKTSEQGFCAESLMFIRDLAITLRLSQPCVATAQVYFNIFAVNHSKFKYDCLLLATACLFLAGKVLEQPRHLETFCKGFYERRAAIQMARNPRLQVPPMSPAMLQKFKQSIIDYEFNVLDVIGFNTEIPLPYSYITNFVNSYNLQPKLKDSFLRCANNFANDSFRTLVALKKEAENIARACIFLASKYLNIEAMVVADPETVEIILELYNN